MRTRLLTAVALVVTLAGCQLGNDAITAPSETSAPASAGSTASFTPPGNFARQGGSVSFRHGTATMWAVRGDTRSMKLAYGDGTPFVTFTVPAGALVRDAQGNTLAKDDSVLITMSLPDANAFAVQMEPSGLTFDSHTPATLEFNLDRAGRAALNSSALSMWKQETPDTPWLPVAATLDRRGHTVTAPIPGFTVYAIIY
jgi:hypothetical protein